MKKPIKKELNNKISKIAVALLDEEKSQKIIGTTIYIVLAVVSLFMTIINLVSGKGFLIIVTGAFGFLCLINIMICLSGKIGVRVARVFITVELFAMFAYFLIWGEPEGFSAIWICLLPATGMLFYGRKIGSILSIIELFILIFFLWTPWGNKLLQHDYFTITFSNRFPLLFFAFYAVAFFLEVLRSFAIDEAKRLGENYKQISIRDQLTKVYNRTGLYEEIYKKAEKATFRKMGLVILDIDFFKQVNDNYGHIVGDKVLVDFAKILSESVKAIVCRWGGEEFAMVYYDDDVKSIDLENLRKKIEKFSFNYSEVKSLQITASMGVCETADHDMNNFHELVKKADHSLYKAKVTGRNKVVYY